MPGSPSLDQLIRDFQRMVATMPTESLITGMAEDMVSLDDKITSLETARRNRDCSPHGEERYYEAFGQLIGTVVTVAVAATELTFSREAAWSFTTSSGPAPGADLN